MKYLKLKTIEKLPDAKIALPKLESLPFEYKIKPSHITFAYFGETKVDERLLTTMFSGLKPFVLRKVRADTFGKNKDIPVVVYEVTEKEHEIKLHDVRLQILQAYNLLDQNFANWTPHVSSVDFNESPDLIKVVGIEADDKTFNFDL
jgi:2'-5' RNA ligase